MDQNPDPADGDEEAVDQGHIYARMIYLAPSISFQVSFHIPFSIIHIIVGKNSFERLRKQVLCHSEDADAHITLAAHLLSEKPLLPALAREAAEQSRMALRLMPSDEEIGDKAQRKAMVHAFLGDALIVLGERQEAHENWNRAIALDPVSPPYGISGLAQEMLNKYPLPF